MFNSYFAANFFERNCVKLRVTHDIMLFLMMPRLFLCMYEYAFRMREPLYHGLCCIKTCETAFTVELLNIKRDYENG